MMLRFSEADRIPVCPHCESPNTQRKLSVIASVRMDSAGSTSSVGSSCGPQGGFS
jgi:hypothetical protein